MICQCGVFKDNAPLKGGTKGEAHHVADKPGLGKCHMAVECFPQCPYWGEGRKDDFGKQRYDLIPFSALAQVVAVLTKGAEKYAPENWRKVEGWRWRYLGAALRHICAWAGGEKLDPEWGLPHLAHAACCVLFLLELDE